MRIHSRCARTVVALCVLGVFCARSFAAPPQAVANYTKQAPVVDGLLDDAEWSKASPVTFPAGDSNPSEVRFLWSADGVYVSFRATDATPAFGHFKPGEMLYQEDVFELFFDQSGDQKQYFEIQASPAGQVFIKNYVLTAPPQITPQGRLTPEFAISELWRWDWPVPEGFQIASRLDPKTGVWTLEMFLPAAFVNLRQGGAPMKPCTWRLNLVRHDWDGPKDAPDRHVKFLYWAPVLTGHPHLSPTLMGFLELKSP